jgi:hypothetical protein
MWSHITREFDQSADGERQMTAKAGACGRGLLWKAIHRRTVKTRQPKYGATATKGFVIARLRNLPVEYMG